MPIWDNELIEIAHYCKVLKDRALPLEEELNQLIKKEDRNSILWCSRRVLEKVVYHICREQSQQEFDSNKSSLKSLIDRLWSKRIIPENIYYSMCHVNGIGNLGTHTNKEFCDRQVRESLLSLTTVIEWFACYLDISLPETLQTSVSKKVAICYKRHIETDEHIADLLEEQLTQNGYTVFIDRHLKIGDEWKQKITQYVQQADAVIILLSAASIYSEMLAEEVELAYQTAQENKGLPHLLPVRINFKDALPQNLANLLGKLQYVLWQSPTDDKILIQHILEKLTMPPVEPVKRYELEMVGGAIPLDSKFYVERSVDEQFQIAIDRRDSIVLLKGARQVGKTSLLARGLQQAREAGVTVLLTDFQWLDSIQLKSLENFFIALGEMLADQLGLDVSPREKWRVNRAPKMNFDNFFRRELLTQIEKPILWAIDEADRLFLCSFSSEVFSLFRVWHNERATQLDSPCSRLTLAIAYATETYFFIQDPAQSPFNVGTKLVLGDFTYNQVQDLHQRYGTPLNDTELTQFFDLTGGQPYLVRRGLNEIVAHHFAFADFMQTADHDEGPFGDHLRRIGMLISKETQLASAMHSVLAGKLCPDHDSFYRLRGLGVLIGDSKDKAQLRCELYTRYLRRNILDAGTDAENI